MARPDSAEWTAAKSLGDDGERLVCEHFGRLGWEVTRTVGDAPYDLLLIGRVEVKTDRRAAETGHVAVEVSYRGEPSGIHTTTSVWWAVVLTEEVLFVRSSVLLEAVQSGRYREVAAGDGHAARVRLVPVDELRALSAYRVDRRSEAASW